MAFKVSTKTIYTFLNLEGRSEPMKEGILVKRTRGLNSSIQGRFFLLKWYWPNFNRNLRYEALPQLLVFTPKDFYMFKNINLLMCMEQVLGKHNKSYE